MNNIEKTSKKKKIITALILGGILLLLAAGEITYFIVKNNSHDENEEEIDSTIMWKKPIIYLYPEEQMEISIKLGKKENLTCSYPKYEDGWDVIANPDGTLLDLNTGRKLYSLYWEGIQSNGTSFEDGFVVKGNETIEFLEEKLAILGLNEYEAEEFIVYWLPELQNNEYNLIRFATIEEINEVMPLIFSKEPDTLIRVLMQFKALDKYEEVKEQKLEQKERKGFTVVEWGGEEIK